MLADGLISGARTSGTLADIARMQHDLFAQVA
jgi:hypothetical protein